MTNMKLYVVTYKRYSEVKTYSIIARNVQKALDGARMQYSKDYYGSKDIDVLSIDYQHDITRVAK
jgi:hypothetical protein